MLVVEHFQHTGVWGQELEIAKQIPVFLSTATPCPDYPKAQGDGINF
jgi:hypothetical protein